MMTASTLYLPEVASDGDRVAPVRAANWLSLSAAPTFAFMAALAGVLGSSAPDVLCSALSQTSAPNGMVTMYLLMSGFHLAPWLQLLSRRPSGNRAAGLTREAGSGRRE